MKRTWSKKGVFGIQNSVFGTQDKELNTEH